MTLYLDTSSLVKLYIAELGSDAVRRLVDQAAVVTTYGIAYPETRAALARRRRERALTPAAFTRATRGFEDDWPSLSLPVTQSASLARPTDAFGEGRKRTGNAAELTPERPAGLSARVEGHDGRRRSGRSRQMRARVSGRASLVVMMQTADLGDLDDPACARWLRHARARSVCVERQDDEHEEHAECGRGDREEVH